MQEEFDNLTLAIKRMQEEEFDNLTLAKKIAANCCWPVYVPNCFFFNSPEMAEKITKEAKKQMRKALVKWNRERMRLKK